MKTINNNLASKFALAAFLALGTLAVTSCNKDKNQTEQEVQDGQNQIVVRIAGISDGEISNGPKSSSNNKTSIESNIKIVKEDGFDAIIGVDNNVPSTETNPIAAAGLKASNGTRAASTPMASTTTYRLYLYKNTGGTYTFVKSMQFTPGTETPIQVPNGSYKWAALSYNNTDAIPDAISSSNILLPENKDVLFASSGATDIVINSNTAPLNITFNRVFAKIAVEVNTLGLFARMTANPTISITAPNAIKTGTLDLTTGTLSGLTSGTNLALTATNFTDITPVGTEAYQKVAYFYTAQQPEQTITASVSAIKVKIDDGTVRDFGTTTSNQSIKVTPTAGKSQRVLVGIAESALAYKGVNWSRSNLHYKAGDPTPYHFYHLNQATQDPNSYFSFGGIFPRVLAKQSQAKDPCALVYPAGLWKAPTNAQLNGITSVGLGAVLGVLGLGNVGGIDALVGVQDALALKVDASTPTATYSEFTSETPTKAAYGAATSAVNKLRFNYNGFVHNIALVENLITLDLAGTGGKYTAFWTSENLLATPIINVGVTHFLGHTDNAFLSVSKGFKSYHTTNLLGISVLNAVDVVKSSLMNVRCVRDANWTATSTAPGYNPMPVYPTN